MQARDGIVDAIGNTPLIVLKRASAATRCTILGKAEFMNPGQSVKDRPARQIILEAEKRGEIKPGGLVVEATAGNTGIGLALVANARGYRTLIVIPETQSQEKKDTLRLCGAELVEVPAVPYGNRNNYQHIGQAAADVLVIVGTAVGDGRDLHQLRAQKAQCVLLLLALRVGNDDHRTIAARAGHEGQADAGVAGGGLDHQTAGFQLAAFLGLEDHLPRRPVLDRLAGIHEFGLAQDGAPGRL